MSTKKSYVTSDCFDKTQKKSPKLSSVSKHETSSRLQLHGKYSKSKIMLTIS